MSQAIQQRPGSRQDSLRARPIAPPPPREWRVFPRRSTVLLAFGLFLLLGGSKLILAAGPEAMGYIMFYSKEGIVESLGATFCLMAAAFLVAAFLTDRSGLGPDAFSTARVLLLLMAIFALGMAGEELGWGTRLVKWLSPGGASIDEFELGEYLRSKGTTTNMLAVYWTMGMFIYGAIFPWFVRISRNVAWLVRRFRLPLPSFALSRLWLIVTMAAIVGIFSPSALRLGPLEIEPAFETAYELLFLYWAAEEYQRVRTATHRSWTLGLKASLCAILLVSSLSMAYDVSVRGWPATRSQQLYSRGFALMDSSEPSDREEAKRYFTESMEAYAGNDAAYHAMGVMLMKEGQYADAVKYLYDAVLLIPESGLYHHALGRAYLNMRDPNTLGSALRELDEAIRLLPPTSPDRNEALLERDYIFGLKKIAQQVGSLPQFRKKLEEIRNSAGQEGQVNESSVPRAGE